jgi:hypothetical protein
MFEIAACTVKQMFMADRLAWLQETACLFACVWACVRGCLCSAVTVYL